MRKAERPLSWSRGIALRLCKSRCDSWSGWCNREQAFSVNRNLSQNKPTTIKTSTNAQFACARPLPHRGKRIIHLYKGSRETGLQESNIPMPIIAKYAVWSTILIDGCTRIKIWSFHNSCIYEWTEKPVSWSQGLTRLFNQLSISRIMQTINSRHTRMTQVSIHC